MQLWYHSSLNTLMDSADLTIFIIIFRLGYFYSFTEIRSRSGSTPMRSRNSQSASLGPSDACSPGAPFFTRLSTWTSSSEPHPVIVNIDVTKRVIAKKVRFTSVKLSAPIYNADKKCFKSALDNQFLALPRGRRSRQFRRRCRGPCRCRGHLRKSR